MTETILLVVHSEWREKRIHPLLVDRGCKLEWCCPMDGQPLPENHRDYLGAVVFGGVQSANDAPAVDYMQRELDWIGRYVEDGGRYLGICLGGQLLARALGAKVDFHPEGLHEIGYHPIRALPAAGSMFDGLSHVYHWHKEGFELPRCAELLAEGERFPNQAFRYRQAYALQFHPEVTGADARGWLDEVSDYHERPGAQPRELHLEGIERHDGVIGRWVGGFLDHWLGGPKAVAAPTPALRVAAR
jgi:GMP synthase (glutamine-hydrolysing)